MLYEFIEKQKTHTAGTELFRFELGTLDPTGVQIEKWVVSVSEVTTVDFGWFDADSNESQTVSVQIKPLDCELLFG